MFIYGFRVEQFIICSIVAINADTKFVQTEVKGTRSRPIRPTAPVINVILGILTLYLLLFVLLMLVCWLLTELLKTNNGQDFNGGKKST